MTPPRVSIVITTRNRREEVSVAIDSGLSQTEPCEVIVFDDASEDGTSAWIQAHYPSIRLITRDQPFDSCVNRNEGFRLAQGEFVISLDDDSFLCDPGTARGVVEVFEAHPEAAILSLAYVEPRSGADRSMNYPPPHASPMCSYVACAAAFRLSSVRAVDGYRDVLVHQGEERDLAIRILDRGESLLYVETPPIVHLYSPKRNQGKMNFYGYRNTILFCWMRVPFPDCFFRAVIDTAQLLRYKFSLRTLGPSLWALAAGWWGGLRYWRERKPVRRETWRLYRSLPRHGPLPLTEGQREEYRQLIEERLPTTPGGGT